MNVVQGGGTGEITIERKIAGNPLGHDPIHQLSKQLRVILELRQAHLLRRGGG
jgi:hypothetical protein